jgi:hypothetical protein
MYREEADAPGRGLRSLIGRTVKAVAITADKERFELVTEDGHVHRFPC